MKQNQPLTIKRLSKVLSRDTTVEENSEIDLIANSGVQFLDFEINFESDKNPANEINFESDDLNTYPAYVKFGKAQKRKARKLYARELHFRRRNVESRRRGAQSCK